MIYGDMGELFFPSMRRLAADNQFQLAWRQGINRYWASDGDIVVGDFTGNGYREIALCTGWNITIIRAFGDNDWREIARYRNIDLYLELFPCKFNQNYNDFIINTVSGPPWKTRILKTSDEFLPGDVNDNGKVNGLDVVYLVNYLKGRIQSLPGPFARGDANGDCTINFLDVTFLVNYIKGVGPLPQPGWCQNDLDG